MTAVLNRRLDTRETAGMDKKENNLKCEDSTSCENETQSQQPPAGIARRLGSGIYSVGAGAVGMGFGGLKWAVSTTYAVGSGVASGAATKLGLKKSDKDKSD